MANQSIYAAFERLWQHILAKVSTKADINHNHDSTYETKTDAQAKLDEAKEYVDESIPTKTSDLTNDSGFITDYTETDPTVPSHVKSISTTDISNWNAKADWNQNDETAIDYIKNRPFYENGVETILVEETSVEIGEDLYAQFSDSLMCEIGATYIVNFDGIEYECVAWYGGDGCVMIGNGSIYGGYGGNDEPFAIETYDDGTGYLNTTMAGTYSISISHMINEIYKIDEKYIPNPDWNASEGEAGYVQNRTHYEADETFNEPLNITWDGNTEGLVNVGDMYYKISDAVLHIDQLAQIMRGEINALLGVSGGEPIDLTTFSFSPNENLDGFTAEMVTFILKPSAVIGNYVFPECGIYFAKVDENTYGSAFITDFPVEQTKIVVHKLDAKYLPSDIPTDDHINSLIDAKSPDWNASEGEAGYVKNRTHYEADEFSVCWADKTVTSGATPVDSMMGQQLYRYAEYIDNSELPWYENGTEVVLVVDGISYNTIVRSDGCGFGDANLVETPIFFSKGSMGWDYVYMANPNETHVISVYKRTGKKIKQLDEKFIPDTIARVTDVETANSALKSELEGKINAKAETSDIPTKVSDLENDAEYITADEVPTVMETDPTVPSHVKSITTGNITNWNTAYTHSQSAHARTDATNVADSTTNGNVLINGTETNVYTHPNSGVTAGNYKSVTVNSQGHITAGTNPTTLAGYGITDAETKGAASSALASAKEYTDSIAAEKSDKTHNHDSAYDTKGAAASALASAQTYADSAATTAANKVKTDLLNNAGGAYDTLKELGDLIDDNTDAIDALETVAAGKADKTHSHAIADVSGLQTALDGKAASSHGTHVSYSTTTPVMDGTASAGSASTVARSDHKHPTDTSRASKTEFDSHTSNTTAHITSAERSNWNAAKTHADSAHAPSNAQPNQNAFSNITVGSTTVSADTATDTVTFAGSNVTITPDATNDKITFSVADGSTSAKGLVQLTNSTSSTSTTTAATPSSVKSAYDLANQAKTAAAAAQTTADGKVPTSRTVNGKALSSDITLSASDVGAASSGHTHNYAGSPSAGGGANSLVVTDTRDVNDTPAEITNLIGKGARLDFKQTSTVGLNNGTYATVLSISPWTDVSNWSGGKNTQLGFCDDGRIQVRKGNGSGWTSWNTIIDSSTIGSQSVNYATSAGSASSATTASKCSGNAATATNVAWSGVTSKPSYYDAKAIKSITRSGTTFTYTCMDGTTGTFTQQDNNTTYTLGSFGITATAAELNKLDGVTATTTELNYVDGVTSNIQTQLNNKQTIISYGTTLPSTGVNGQIFLLQG